MLRTSATSPRVRKRPEPSAVLGGHAAAHLLSHGERDLGQAPRLPSSLAPRRDLDAGCPQRVDRTRCGCPIQAECQAMQVPSPAPRRVATPRWLDLRVVLGIVLVLAAVGLGAVVVSRARHTTPRGRRHPRPRRRRDVALVRPDRRRRATAGHRARTSTTRTRRSARCSPAPLGSGELVPAAAVAAAPARTTVTIPFGADSAPELRRGERIVVWLSTRDVPERGAAAGRDGAGRAGLRWWRVLLGRRAGRRGRGRAGTRDARDRRARARARGDPRRRAQRRPVRPAGTLPSLAGCGPSDSP